VDTALFPKGGPPAAALRVSRGDEAPVPEVPCPAADSLLALVALVGFMKLSDELGRMEEEGAVPRLPLSGLAGGPPLATDDIVIPVMLDVALFFTLPSLTLFDADELDLLRFSFEPWILLWLELIALDVNVFARLSLKFDIVDRLGLESVFEFESATVLCRDLLLDVMLFLLGEFSLLRLLLPRLPLAEDSLNMDMEFLGVTTDPLEGPPLMDPLVPVAVNVLLLPREVVIPSRLLLRKFLVRSRIFVRAPPALELLFS